VRARRPDSDDLVSGDEETAIDEQEADGVGTPAADVESAGRSCLVILALVAVIVVLLLAWIVFTSTGGRR
jgi:hypothetical protein